MVATDDPVDLFILTVREKTFLPHYLLPEKYNFYFLKILFDECGRKKILNIHKSTVISIRNK